MRQSWLLLGFLGVVTSSGPASGAADQRDLVLTRQELRRQVYLYNGWMADVLRDRDASSPITPDPLPLDRVVPALLGQFEERTLSPEDLAVQRERLTRWIELLATVRRFHGRKPYLESPIPNAGAQLRQLPEPLRSQLLGEFRGVQKESHSGVPTLEAPGSKLLVVHSGVPTLEAPGSKLPVASVALHFRRSKPGSSLARDFRDESDAYARLRRIPESLLSEFRVKQEEFQKANPGLDDAEMTRQFESSKDVSAWLSKVQENLVTIDRECATIGYPVSIAWAIREEVEGIRQALKAIESKVEFKPSAYRVVSASTPVTLVVTSLEKLASTSREAGGLCQALSEAYADPPGGIDAGILDLAWSSIVPLFDPDPKELATRLKHAAGWIDATGLKKYLWFDSLEIAGPTRVQLSFRTTASFWNARPVVLSTRYIGFQNRLFYKFTGAIAATPAAVSMTINGGGASGAYDWHKGLLSGSVRQYTASAPAEDELNKDDLAKILPKVALASSETDSVATLLSRSARNFLVKYLTTFQGKVDVIHDDPVYLRLRVSNAKNLVLATANLWEDLDINFIIATQAQGAKLLCIVDGQYASGGFAPKSVEAFRDMEPQYSKNLNDFAGQLLVRIKDELLKQNGDTEHR